MGHGSAKSLRELTVSTDMLREAPLQSLCETVFSSHFSLPFPLIYTNLSLHTDLAFIWLLGSHNDDEGWGKRGMPNGHLPKISDSSKDGGTGTTYTC